MDTDKHPLDAECEAMDADALADRIEAQLADLIDFPAWHLIDRAETAEGTTPLELSRLYALRAHLKLAFDQVGKIAGKRAPTRAA